MALLLSKREGLVIHLILNTFLLSVCSHQHATPGAFLAKSQELSMDSDREKFPVYTCFPLINN